MKFGAMAIILTLDDLYASSLYEEKMTKTAGKKLPVYYHRFMGINYENNKHNQTNDDFLQSSRSIVDHDGCVQADDVFSKKNPLDGYCILKFFRFIYKMMRICYISITYYFMPLFAVGINVLYLCLNDHQ